MRSLWRRCTVPSLAMGVSSKAISTSPLRSTWAVLLVGWMVLTSTPAQRKGQRQGCVKGLCVEGWVDGCGCGWAQIKID